MVWCGVAGHGVAWCGLVCFTVVRCGLVWCDVAWYGGAWLSVMVMGDEFRVMTQRSLICYVEEMGPETVGFGGLNGLLLPGHPSKKMGGFAPHLFRLASR